MKYTPEFIQKIRDSVNILEVVGEHVVLRKSGANYSGLCPFHSERSPSFSVSETKQLYHCYGCKKGGDLFSFVIEIFGIDFPEAVEELAERARIALPAAAGAPANSKEDPEVAKRRAAAREKLQLAYRVNRFVAAYYRNVLSDLPQIERYFSSRGISPTSDLARNFYLGGSPGAWDGLTKHLLEKKAPLPIALELGLIRPSPKTTTHGPGYFDLFRNRAMFPILDLRGKVAGFGGRSMPTPKNEGDGDSGPKYLNSSESLVYQKGKLAFGLYQAQKHIRAQDEVILVEGYFDVLALHAAGIENVVATCGTSLTVDHLNIFRKFCSKITVLFDGDSAGINATERAMELGLDHGVVLYGTSMPADLDPDEILFDQETGRAIAGGRERMLEILQKAEPILDTQIANSIGDSRKGPEAQTQALKRMATWLNRFKDPVGRQVRLERIQTEMGLSGDLLAQVFRTRPGPGSPMNPPPGPIGPRVSPKPGVGPRPRAPAPARTKKPAQLTQSEKILLGAMVRGGEWTAVLREVRGNLPESFKFEDLFEYPPAQAWVTDLLTRPGALESFRDSPELLSELDPQLRMVLTESMVSSGQASKLVQDKDGEGGPIQELRAAAASAIGRAWARFSQHIKTAIADAEAKKDAELHQRLMQEYLDVQRKMKDFTTLYDKA